MQSTYTTPDCCPHCGSERVGWSHRLVMPRGWVWFVRCVACGWRVEA